MADVTEEVSTVRVETNNEQYVADNILSNVMLSNESGKYIPFKLIENSDTVWINLLQNPTIFGDNNYIRGFVNGPEELESILEAHKRATTSSYSVRTSNSKRDKDGVWKKNIQPVFVRNWEPKMQFDCTPFVVVKVTYMECEFGRDYWRKDIKHKDDHNYHNLPVNATLDPEPIPGSRKRGCLARLTIYEVLIFTEYKIANSSDMVPHQLREIKSQRIEELRKKLHNKEDVSYDTRFFVELPFKSAHRYHDPEVADGLQLRVHHKIIDRIHQHVSNGTTNREKMKSLIGKFVKEELSSCGVEPNPLDRSYNPTDRDVANHIYRAISIEKYKRIDHNAINETISKLQGNQKVFYQPSTEKAFQKPKEKSDGDTIFMLIYQETWQINLMMNKLKTFYVIDSTYRTLKYPLPLYTVWIYIDEKFICVATIIIQSDSADELTQALSHLRRWNPEWQPEFLLLDAQQPCWNAVEQAFPDSKVFISSFHCNQSWSQFLSSDKMSLSESSRLHILSLLQRAANSSSREGYTEAVDMIKTTQEWKNSQYLRYVINRFWFHNYKKWATSCQPEELVMAMSANAQDKLRYAFEYTYFPRIWDMTVSSLLEVLSETFFPEVVRTDGNLEQINMDRTSLEQNEKSDVDDDDCDENSKSSGSSETKLAIIKNEIRILCKEIDIMSQNCSHSESLVKVLESLKKFKKDLVFEITNDFKDSRKRSRKQRIKMQKAQRIQETERPNTSETLYSNNLMKTLNDSVLVSNSIPTAVLNESVIHIVNVDQTDESCEVPRVGEAVEISFDHSEINL